MPEPADAAAPAAPEAAGAAREQSSRARRAPATDVVHVAASELTQELVLGLLQRYPKSTSLTLVLRLAEAGCRVTRSALNKFLYAAARKNLVAADTLEGVPHWSVAADVSPVPPPLRCAAPPRMTREGLARTLTALRRDAAAAGVEWPVCDRCAAQRSAAAAPSELDATSAT